MDRVRTDSPISATLVSWANAWLAGHVGLDEAVDRVERAGGPQVVADDPAEATLRAFLADLRISGLTSFRLALPIPGDPLGLTGPPPFSGIAIDAGQAAIAVLTGQAPRRVGLVPAPDVRGSSYTGVRWTAVEAATSEPDVPRLAEAERALNEAILSATDALLSLDGPPQGFGGSGSAQGCGEAPAARRPGATSGKQSSPALRESGETLAPGYPGPAHRVGALTGRLAVALSLAGERGLTSGQLTTHREALRELDRAVRRARVAAHHAIFEQGRV